VAVKYYSAGSARIAMRKAGVVTYLFGDHLGSTSVVFDDSTNGIQRQGYTAFGSERYSLGGDLPTRYQFTGQRGFEEIGLQYYGARWYDGYLNRFLSPDVIVPSTGEGNNPNAVGYVASANYSALVVDYHENQFLEQLNRENRNRQGDPNARLPGVPTNPLTLDRYAYSLNNPTQYVDPSGHNPILLALAAIGPAGWVALGVLTVGTVVYFAAGGPEAVAEGLTPAIQSMSNQAANGINVSFHKNDWIPPNLTKEQQKLWGRAAELYKKGLELPDGFQLPKDLAEDLAELIREGLSPDQAADELGELEDYSDDE